MLPKFSPLFDRPRGEKDITQVSGTCSPGSIPGGGTLLWGRNASLIWLVCSYTLATCGVAVVL